MRLQIERRGFYLSYFIHIGCEMKGFTFIRSNHYFSLQQNKPSVIYDERPKQTALTMLRKLAFQIITSLSFNKKKR